MVTIDELRTVYALQDLPDEHLQWIIDRSQYEEHEDGSIMMKTGAPADDMFMLLEGKVSFFMDINGRLVHYFTFENDSMTGGVSGLLPYSRMKNSPGYSYAVGKLRLLRLHKKYFHDLEQLNPDLIQKLIGYMTERARYFATQQLQQEKVSALGKLAAGIAHELNNPASAINRISSELHKRLKCNFELTQELVHDGITPEQVEKINELVEKKEKETKVKISTMQRIEREDEIADLLEKNNVKERQLAETFADAGFTGEDFEMISRISTGKSFRSVVRWMENLLSSNRVIRDLDEASSRISILVGAIKSHVHMDRTSDMQPTDIHKDIDNTLILLGYKMRQKNIKVIKNYGDNIPEVPAYVGELNQVWTNLIDNAIYAMPEKGELKIETFLNQKDVKIKVMDNGSGIPKDIQSRIFDPFFTTKKVGEGTGIGLDIVKKIITKHNGDIKVISEPGKTEFIVCLPLNPAINPTDLPLIHS